MVDCHEIIKHTLNSELYIHTLLYYIVYLRLSKSVKIQGDTVQASSFKWPGKDIWQSAFSVFSETVA